ncbi:MAG: dTDP-4-amino-4,6-dideoxygalactose transaminase [Bacteroidales bacterium]|nr:dTDP-4-amino-4,6-dideoxygalactose transaminase [Bacteroidales bacterium]
MNIPFNKPYLTGKETEYIQQAVASGKISGNGIFTQKCQQFFEQHYSFRKCLMTTSCTDALEMAAILCDLHPGDEVIVPSYTFVSSALAFVRAGAKIVFADSEPQSPSLDVNQLEGLITPRTKVIVPVHYAGVACEMDSIMALAEKYHLIIVEDAAQAIDSQYKGVQLGSIGHLAAFSFHETKNIIAGEGGLLVINDEQFVRRAEIIWEKGTNRAAFFRGEVAKYNWVDIGSSFLPNELTSAFLYAQLECLDQIQQKRLALWNRYYQRLRPLEVSGLCRLPNIPSYATNNAHMFYLLLPSLEIRTALIERMRHEGIGAVSHYISLHSSPFYLADNPLCSLPNSDHFTDCLLRLPMFYELSFDDVDLIANVIADELSHHTAR